MHIFVFLVYFAHLDLHSFPTRRSSDLSTAAAAACANSSVCSTTRAPHCRSTSAIRCVGWRGSSGRYAPPDAANQDRKSTRLNSSHRCISYAVFCLKKKKKNNESHRPTQ